MKKVWYWIYAILLVLILLGVWNVLRDTRFGFYCTVKNPEPIVRPSFVNFIAGGKKMYRQIGICRSQYAVYAHNYGVTVDGIILDTNRDDSKEEYEPMYYFVDVGEPVTICSSMGYCEEKSPGPGDIIHAY